MMRLLRSMRILSTGSTSTASTRTASSSARSFTLRSGPGPHRRLLQDEDSFAEEYGGSATGVDFSEYSSLFDHGASGTGPDVYTMDGDEEVATGGTVDSSTGPTSATGTSTSPATSSTGTTTPVSRPPWSQHATTGESDLDAGELMAVISNTQFVDGVPSLECTLCFEDAVAAQISQEEAMDGCARVCVGTVTNNAASSSSPVALLSMVTSIQPDIVDAITGSTSGGILGMYGEEETVSKGRW